MPLPDRADRLSQPGFLALAWRRARLHCALWRHGRKDMAGARAESVQAWLSHEQDAFLAPEARSAAFFNLLLAHGPFDVGNPISRDELAHFELHPAGIHGQDVEWSLDEAHEESFCAQERLALLCLFGCSFANAREHFGLSVLESALAQALIFGSHERWGADGYRAISQALRSGALSPSFALGAAAARALVLRSRARARCAPSEPSAPAAPLVDIDLWRSRRQNHS